MKRTHFRLHHHMRTKNVTNPACVPQTASHGFRAGGFCARFLINHRRTSPNAILPARSAAVTASQFPRARARTLAPLHRRAARGRMHPVPFSGGRCCTRAMVQLPAPGPGGRLARVCFVAPRHLFAGDRFWHFYSVRFSRVWLFSVSADGLNLRRPCRLCRYSARACRHGAGFKSRDSECERSQKPRHYVGNNAGGGCFRSVRPVKPADCSRGRRAPGALPARARRAHARPLRSRRADWCLQSAPEIARPDCRESTLGNNFDI